MAANAQLAPHEGRARSGSDGPLRSRGQGEEAEYNTGQGYAQRYHGSKAWWSVGEFLHQGITHQSVGLSLGQQEGEEPWELSDSLADLYQAVTQRQRKAATKINGHNRTGSSGGGAKAVSDRQVDIQRWLDEDTSHGFIRVFASDQDTHARLFPCTLSTSAQKICLQLGIPGNSLHVQLSGDVIRRMEPFDCPLAVQNEYLEGLGYSDIKHIQEEGPKDDLAYLVRFYAGKPLSDFTYSRHQLSTYVYVRKGKLLHQWVRRHCVISGTRLLIHREKGTEPTVVQLAKGSVEEVTVKGQSLVLKLTSTLMGERSIYLSFISQEDYNKWLKKIKKATAKLPSKADLSNCHLEFLPETVFINTELQVLILRHNALRERPIEEDIYTIGWLDDLPRFTMLRSLNLANNQLSSFPASVCGIRSLLELNLASNQLEEIPPQISELVNLKVLHLHNNLLSSLPEELAYMRNLAVIVLAFNRFTSIPAVLLQSQHATFMLDSLIMAGNQISRLPADQLMHMKHVKKIDLRLNRLQLLPTETAKFQSLEHVTHVDIRENQVKDLDIRAIRAMEYLNCERNVMRSLQLNGGALKNLFASHNCLQTLSINPKPEWLVSMNVSHNKLAQLPSWLPDCFFLIHLDVSHNHLKELPERLFTDAQKLKVVKANNNRLTALPDAVRTDTLEELHIHHNLIRSLPVDLFIKAHRLRYLNVTRNKLSDLPPPNKNDSYNKLQELYLSFNHLANRALHKICCFPRLRVLHMSRNKLTVIEETDMEKLEQLTELNISSNNLTYLPSALGRHPKLQVLRASCNLLQELPNFKNSSGLKVLEVSSNHLVNVNMGNLMASQVSLLDISANPSILVKSQDIEAAKNSKRLCMVDMRGQNWSTEDVRGHDEGKENSHLWQTGLSQTSGIRNKLSVTAVNKPHYGDGNEALFAIFDGGRNDTVSNLLCELVPTLLREERARCKKPEVYLKYCLLSAHRNLRANGQKLGASAAVVHLHKDEKGQFVLSVANVGDVQVVLCRQRRAFPLSRTFVVTEDEEEKKRVVKSGGIITEDGRVSGVTYTTRMIGSSYLYPYVTPEPHVTSTTLTPEDTMFIVASQGLWTFMTHDEAVREVKDCPDPIVAAKRLQDLAQGYGSRENISVLVVRLMLTHGEREKVRDQLRVQRKGQRELLKVLSQQVNLLQLRDGVPQTEDLENVVIDKAGHAKKHHRGSRKQLPDSSTSVSHRSSLSEASWDSDSVFVVEKNSQPNQQSREHNADTEMRKLDSEKQGNLYKKKSGLSSQNSVDSVLKQRLENEVKSKEILLDLEQNGQGNHEGQDDEDNVDKDLVNWVAMKQKEKATNPKEWESQLQQRLTQEIVSRELRKALEKDIDNEVEEEEVEEEKGENWQRLGKTKTSTGYSIDGILSRKITRPGKTGRAPDHPGDVSGLHRSPDIEMLPQAGSVDSLKSDVIRMMANSSHSQFQEGGDLHSNTHPYTGADVDGDSSSGDERSQNGEFNISPCESVSSIDVRLHEEADEIYRLRHFTAPIQPHQETTTHFQHAKSADATLNEVESVQGSQVDAPARPLSPDSLISQDDFVKPPICNLNIDRDALLFHQMQMARAQAHAGSVASLDSIQSAPMHVSRRDLAPDVKASSHSIEVLVNVGVDKKPEKKSSSVSGAQSSHGIGDSVNEGRIEWSSGSSLGDKKTKTKGSTSTLTGSNKGIAQNEGPGLESFHRVVEVDYSPGEINLENSSNSGVQMTTDLDQYDEDDDEDDRDTLIGDDGEVAQMDSLEDFRRSQESLRNGEDKSFGSYSSGITVLGTQFTNVKRSKRDLEPEEDMDSDSDDSIGNASLEDGYDAIEFDNQRIGRQGSLSMLNVLESESEDYPELFMVERRKQLMVTSQGKKKSPVPERKISPEPRPVADDYEDIDSDEDNEKLDDDYEDVQFSPDASQASSESSSNSPKPEFRNITLDENKDNSEILSRSVSQGSMPTEEDIDALYAKVNKIKMNKIRDLDASPENDSIFPLVMSDSTASETNTLSGVTFPHRPLPPKKPKLSEEKISNEDSEKEIFISGTDYPRSGSIADLMAKHSASANFHATDFRGSSSNPLKAFKSPFSQTVTTSFSNQVPVSVHPSLKCNTSPKAAYTPTKSPTDSGSGFAETSFKASLGNQPVTTQHTRPPELTSSLSPAKHPPPPPPIHPRLSPSAIANRSQRPSPPPPPPPITAHKPLHENQSSLPAHPQILPNRPLPHSTPPPPAPPPPPAHRTSPHGTSPPPHSTQKRTPSPKLSLNPADLPPPPLPPPRTPAPTTPSLPEYRAPPRPPKPEIVLRSKNQQVTPKPRPTSYHGSSNNFFEAPHITRFRSNQPEPNKALGPSLSLPPTNPPDTANGSDDQENFPIDESIQSAGHVPVSYRSKPPSPPVINRDGQRYNPSPTDMVSGKLNAQRSVIITYL